MRTLTNVTVADNYTDAASLTEVIESAGGYFNVTGADVFMEVQYGIAGLTQWTDEVHIPIGGGILIRGTTGVRFRNFIAGTAAVVSAALAERNEPAIQIAATGQSAVSTVSLGPTPVTNLPASPQDLQQVLLVDNVATPTYAWLLQWDAALNLWIFVGGSPGFGEVDTNESTASTVYTALATAGPSFTLPRSGTYIVEVGFRPGDQTAAGNAFMSYDIGGTAASDNDAAKTGNTGAGNVSLGYSVMQAKKKTGLVAGNVLTAKYRCSSAISRDFAFRWIRVTPVTLS